MRLVSFLEVLCVNFDERCQTARINSEYNIQEIPSKQQKKNRTKTIISGRHVEKSPKLNVREHINWFFITLRQPLAHANTIEV